MKQRDRNTEAVALNLKRRLREGLLIASGAVALFLFLALWTYRPHDPAQISTNLTGRLGEGLAHLSFLTVGSMAYLLPALLLYCGWQGFLKRDHRVPAHYLFLVVRLVGFMTIFVSVCGLATLHSTHTLHGYPSGGILGEAVTKNFISQFNTVGSTLFLAALLLASTTLATGFSWMYGLQRLARRLNLLLSQCYTRIRQLGHSLLRRYALKRKKRATLAPIVSPASYNPEKTTRIDTPNPYILPGSAGSDTHGFKIPKDKAGILAKLSPASRLSSKPSSSSPPAPPSLRTIDDHAEARPQPRLAPTKTHAAMSVCDLHKKTAADIALPSLALLDPAETSSKAAYTREELEQLSRDVELRLRDFNIQAQVVAVQPGPVVTRFEIQPAAGIKVNRITGLAKDLARALSVVSVRIVEVIPGKSVVGLEVANRYREIVRLSEILTSHTYQQARSPLSLALGKDIAGHPVIVDLGKMPHLLVAGTTGSGKSVGLNAMLLSILYKATAQEVRLIMIDPKMLELAIYEGIPHLLTPVVTDMKEAARALRWCVSEMERRYKLMARLGVRNVAGYNQKIKAGKDEGHPLRDPFWTPEQGDQAEDLEPLPYIIVLIDEFADMMMVVGKKVEELIARIAQKARAAGIHLILATQRPSVDVITGLIKANIPTRIAFQVSSKIDSRTILDQQGADQLLGHGDMLYLAPGTGLPIRVHGAFVADQEVHDVVNALRKTGAPEYSLDLSQVSSDPSELSSECTSEDWGEKDGLYDEAVQILLETRRASVSNIQRRLKIGYNRAARLMEDMEKAGLVSTMENNGNREILVPNRLTE